MRLLNAHVLEPSNLSCALMAIRSSKSLSTEIFDTGPEGPRLALAYISFETDQISFRISL